MNKIPITFAIWRKVIDAAACRGTIPLWHILWIWGYLDKLQSEETLRQALNKTILSIEKERKVQILFYYTTSPATVNGFPEIKDSTADAEFKDSVHRYHEAVKGTIVQSTPPEVAESLLGLPDDSRRELLWSYCSATAIPDLLSQPEGTQYVDLDVLIEQLQRDGVAYPDIFNPIRSDQTESDSDSDSVAAFFKLVVASD